MEVRIYIVPFIFIVLNITKYEVLASKGPDPFLDKIYGSYEKRLKHAQLNFFNPHDRQSNENDKAEFPTFLRRRNKMNEHNNKNNGLLPDSSRKNEKRKKKNTIKKHKPKRKIKYNKKFIKTTLKDIDRDSNMSGSKDGDNKNKPVDIIVHIKMNE